MGNDFCAGLWHTSPMTELDPTEREFNESFCDRVRQLRRSTGMSAEAMAELLRVGASGYRKYEVRSPMPARLLVPFARITGVSLDYLLTGKNNRKVGPLVESERGE